MKRIIRTGLAVAILCFMMTAMAFGDDITIPSGVKQIGASDSNVEFQWEPSLNARAYEFRWSKDNVNWSNPIYVGNSVNTYLEGLSPGKSYSIQLRTLAKNESGATFYSGWSEKVEMVTAPQILNNLQGVKQVEGDTSSAKIIWDSVEGANRYKVIIMPSGNPSPKRTIVTSKKYVSLTGLTADSKYKVEVFPLRKSSNGFEATKYFSKGNITTTSTKVSGLKVDKDYVFSERISLKWTPKNNAYGYQISLYNYRTKATTYKHIKENCNGSGAFDIDNGAFYRVKIRSYVIMGDGSKRYSSWSDLNYINLQNLPKLNQYKKSIQVTWNKVYGATGYDVYISDSSNGAFYKACTSCGTKTTIKKCKGAYLNYGKTYYVKVVARKNVNGKIYYGTRGSNKSCYISKYF